MRSLGIRWLTYAYAVVLALSFGQTSGWANTQSSTYQHNRWMSSSTRQAILGNYLQRTNFPVVSERTYNEMVQHYPRLRGLRRENVRVANFDDPQLKQFFQRVGANVPLVGMAVHPSGHPYLRLTRTLDEDMVLTIEPGLYIIDMLLENLRGTPAESHVNHKTVDRLRPFGGVRIEDNVRVLPGGNENLTRDAFAELQ